MINIARILFCVLFVELLSYSFAEKVDTSLINIYIGIDNKITLDEAIEPSPGFSVLIGNYPVVSRIDKNNNKILHLTPSGNTPLGKQDVYIKDGDNYNYIGMANVVKPQKLLYFVTNNKISGGDKLKIFLKDLNEKINLINPEHIPNSGIFDISKTFISPVDIESTASNSEKIIGNTPGTVCGRWITQMRIRDLSSVEKISVAAQMADSGIIVNPTTATFPNLLKGVNLEYAPSNADEREKYNNLQWISTGLFEMKNGKLIRKSEYRSFDGRGVIIYVIDTLDGKSWTDSFKGSMNITSYSGTKAVSVNGHGVGIVQIISKIAPKAEIRPIGVCDYDYGHSCNTIKILNSLCSIRDYAIENKQKKIIVNFSLGSIGETAIISAALMDVIKSGAAISISHGNDDTCKEAYGNVLGAFCYQYPVDSIFNYAGVYSTTSLVPAKPVSSQISYNIASFNRGHSGGLMGSPPSIMAPGAFFIKNNPRIGSSYAAGVTSAMLALWSQCHNSKDWPKASQLTSNYFIPGAITIDGAATLLDCS